MASWARAQARPSCRGQPESVASARTRRILSVTVTGAPPGPGRARPRQAPCQWLTVTVARRFKLPVPGSGQRLPGLGAGPGPGDAALAPSGPGPGPGPWPGTRQSAPRPPRRSGPGCHGPVTATVQSLSPCLAGRPWRGALALPANHWSGGFLFGCPRLSSTAQFKTGPG